MDVLQFATHKRAQTALGRCGALAHVEAELRSWYRATKHSQRPLYPARELEKALRAKGWNGNRHVPSHPSITRRTNDSFDGYREFPRRRAEPLRVALEVEWNWERVYFDLLKFWRGERWGKTTSGILVLRTRDMYEYATEVSWRHYAELFPTLKVVFVALDFSDPS